MALDRIINIVLRAAELVFATIVAGVTGQHLHQYRHASDWSQGRWIYTEVIAALSMFFSLIWLVPFSWSFVHWPVDIILSLCWWAAFGLLVNVSLYVSSYMYEPNKADSHYRCWMAPAATSSTGTTSTPSPETSAASSRPTLPLHSCLLFSGLCLLCSESTSPPAMDAALLSMLPSARTAAAGTAEAVSKCELLLLTS